MTWHDVGGREAPPTSCISGEVGVQIKPGDLVVDIFARTVDASDLRAIGVVVRINGGNGMKDGGHYSPR